MMRLLLVLGVLICAACGDESREGAGASENGGNSAASQPGKPGPTRPSPKARRQDEGAMKLLDGADAVSYSPVIDGLLDVSYRFKDSRQPKVAVEVRWVRPHHVGGTLRFEADADAETEAWARNAGPSHVAEAKIYVDLVVGSTNRQQYEDDDVILASENQVRIVARSQKSLQRRLIETVITFGDNGLPDRMESKTLQGDVNLVPTYKKGQHGRWMFDRGDSEVVVQGEAVSRVMTIEYQSVGRYMFPRRVVIQGPSDKVVHEYVDFRVDQGLSPEQVK